MHSRPETRPMPVMRPAPGSSSPYTPCAASAESSRNGEPGSSSAAMRSRASSLPALVCLSRAAALPPAALRCNVARRSSTNGCMAARLSANSGERVSIFETILAIGFVASRVAELSDSPIIQRFGVR